MVHGGVFAKLRSRPSVVGDRTSVELEFVDARTGGCPPPRPQVDVDVMATQRYACEDLGAGDLRGLSAVNITRVMRGRPVRWGEEIGWRHHAYARMPASDLGRSESHLEAFLGLWDGDRVESAENASVASHRVLSARCDRAHALEDGAMRHGLLFELAVDASSFSSAGEAWLWGELLSRALAERESSLRFTQLAWTVGDLVSARFGLRRGCVSPGLFG
jgi:type VI protein secretion system component VasA